MDIGSAAGRGRSAVHSRPFPALTCCNGHQYDRVAFDGLFSLAKLDSFLFVGAVAAVRQRLKMPYSLELIR